MTLSRTFDASLQEVWDLWTTKDGIESWWGPEGFRVEVRSLDLRPGGCLLYAMIAVGEAEIAFMKKEGMPTVTEAKITYVEVLALARLGYTHLVDFVPGVSAYDVATLVELYAEGGRVRMQLSFDAMHDDMWTQRAKMGWESELGKLAKRLAR